MRADEAVPHGGADGEREVEDAVPYEGRDGKRGNGRGHG